VPDDFFGAEVAADYDADVAEMFAESAVTPVVDVLERLAGSGPALELGVGTGRIALPLSRRGVRVHGIDLSAAMVERLRAKPGSEHIDVTVGDIATTWLDQQFAVVFLVFNTIMNLTTQDQQVECFGNAARHLQPGGAFVIEVLVPDLQRLPAGETVRPFTVSSTRLGFDEYDVVTQSLVSHHFARVGDRWESQAVPFRYVWPAELDLMARIAGLTLEDRWSDWTGEPFTAESRSHVSVWRKPG
jgi:SAM-dependent methyltransferase